VGVDEWVEDTGVYSGESNRVYRDRIDGVGVLKTRWGERVVRNKCSDSGRHVVGTNTWGRVTESGSLAGGS
jgi:hypothetical protein